MSDKSINKNSISSRFMLADSNVAKQCTILIFDSGVGGLSVYSEVKKTLPGAKYLYVFDNEMFPYGKKSAEFIIDRVVTIIGAVWRMYELDIIIIACNTASTISLPALRESFSCPIIGVVPAIKSAVRVTRNGIIGLLATHATVQRNYTRDLITQFAGNCQILQLGTSELADMAEAKLRGKMVSLFVLRKLFRPWLEMVVSPDTIILGCTHFPLLSSELQSIFPKGTHLVDSSLAIAHRAAWLVKNHVNSKGLQNKTILNRAYCLTNTPRTMMLLPVLMHYGFVSLEKLTL